MLLTYVALGTLMIVTLTAANALIGMRTILWLRNLPALAPSTSLSIIVAARNEEKNVRAGISSLLRLDYPNKQIIVVNDRSTDRTRDILNELAIANPELRVVSVTDLPNGWIGKNHAQWAGASAADGDLLLFTDADVVMEKSVLRRAVPYFEKNALDHLAIGPQAVMPGVWLNLFMAGFAVFFNLFTRPWLVRNPKSRAHIGIGAFNLIRAETYKKIGTHQAIALRPDDDLKLGKLVKMYGFRQDFVMGTGLVVVEWYDSVKALVNGLMKNVFAGVDYRLSVVIGATIAQLAVGVWPFVAVFLTDGWTRGLYAGAALILIGLCAAAAHAQGLKALYGIGFPLSVLAFLYILWKSTLRTLIRRGIEWRGTFYPLAELRKNKI